MNVTLPPATTAIGLTPELFAAAFPFHFAVDRELKLLQAGRTLSRICLDVRAGGEASALFRILRPEVPFQLEALLEHRTRFFLLEHIASGLQLRGEFVLQAERDALLFLGSPWLRDAAEMAAHGLGFEDFALHDPVVDMLQVYQASKFALGDAKRLAAKLTAQRAELRQANERLLEQSRQNQTLALIAARTTNSVVVTDAAGRIEWVNEGFTRLTGFALPEILGKTPGSVLQGPQTDPNTVAYVRDQLRQGRSVSMEILNYSKAGRAYWIASDIQPIRNEAGEITHFMAVQSDITASRESERLLQEKNAILHGIIEGAGAAIVAVDADYVVQIFNPAAEKLFGYAAADVIGDPQPPAWHDPDELAQRAAMLTLELGHEVKPGLSVLTAKSSLGQPHLQEWTIIRSDGLRVPVLLYITTLFDDEAQVVGHLGIYSDLTELKRADEKLRATLSELERLNRVMMNREERVLELKREINEMCLALGQPPAYPSALEEPVASTN